MDNEDKLETFIAYVFLLSTGIGLLTIFFSEKRMETHLIEATIIHKDFYQTNHQLSCISQGYGTLFCPVERNVFVIDFKFFNPVDNKIAFSSKSIHKDVFNKLNVQDKVEIILIQEYRKNLWSNEYKPLPWRLSPLYLD